MKYVIWIVIKFAFARRMCSIRCLCSWVSNAKIHKFVSLASLFVRYEWQWQWGNSVLSNWMHRHTHTRAHTRSTELFDGWRWCFPLLATHCVCVCIGQTEIKTIGDFRVGKPTHMHKSHARFSVSQKSTQYISDCRKIGNTLEINAYLYHGVRVCL